LSPPIKKASKQMLFDMLVGALSPDVEDPAQRRADTDNAAARRLLLLRPKRRAAMPPPKRPTAAAMAAAWQAQMRSVRLRAVATAAAKRAATANADLDIRGPK